MFIGVEDSSEVDILGVCIFVPRDCYTLKVILVIQFLGPWARVGVVGSSSIIYGNQAFFLLP